MGGVLQDFNWSTLEERAGHLLAFWLLGDLMQRQEERSCCCLKRRWRRRRGEEDEKLGYSTQIQEKKVLFNIVPQFDF